MGFLEGLAWGILAGAGAVFVGAFIWAAVLAPWFGLICLFCGGIAWAAIYLDKLEKE